MLPERVTTDGLNHMTRPQTGTIRRRPNDDWTARLGLSLSIKRIIHPPNPAGIPLDHPTEEQKSRRKKSEQKQRQIQSIGSLACRILSSK